jgi:hypothetical protein
MALVVDVTAEIEFDGVAAVKLQGGDIWELNIRGLPADLMKLRSVDHATHPPGRSLAVGRCADAPVWWNEKDGQVAILVGRDDVTWDIAVMVPLTTIQDILRAVEQEARPR